jgi:hypothetical protein
MKNNTAKFANQSPPRVRTTILRNGKEFGYVEGLKCPSCGAPLHCTDAEALDNVSIRMICPLGHDIFTYGPHP